MEFLRFRHFPAKAALALGFTAAAACAPAALPAAPITAAVAPGPPVPAAPPPAPPPRCESLDELCAAAEGTRANIGTAGTSFAVPLGWHYSQGASRGIARGASGNAVLVVALAAPSDEPGLVATIEQEAAALGIRNLELKKLRSRLKKADGKMPTHSNSVELWEVNEQHQKTSPELGDKGKGTLLVGLDRGTAAQAVVILAFVSEAAAQGDAPKLIMQAVGTLRRAP